MSHCQCSCLTRLASLFWHSIFSSRFIHIWFQTTKSKNNGWRHPSFIYSLRYSLHNSIVMQHLCQTKQLYSSENEAEFKYCLLCVKYSLKRLRPLFIFIKFQQQNLFSWIFCHCICKDLTLCYINKLPFIKQIQ